MALQNTFEYKLDSPTAPADFRDLIAKKEILLFVFGKDPLAEKTAEEADLEADLPLRHVVWMPDYESERTTCIDLLQTMPDFVAANYEKVLAFSLTPISNKAAYIIFRGQVEDDTDLIFRIQKAFWEAGIEEEHL